MTPTPLEELGLERAADEARERLLRTLDELRRRSHPAARAADLPPGVRVMLALGLVVLVSVAVGVDWLATRVKRRGRKQRLVWAMRALLR